MLSTRNLKIIKALRRTELTCRLTVRIGEWVARWRWLGGGVKEEND